MMIEELMQEEFQAGKAEGIAAGVDALKAVVLEVLDMRNMLTDTTKYLLEHTSDMETLKKMSHTAISCRNAEEFLEQFNVQNHTDQYIFFEGYHKNCGSSLGSYYGVQKRIFCLTFLKKKNIIVFERVANQRKSSFAALLYYTVKKCVAYQRKSNL